jgi:PAS domain S-box-containing protein
MTINEASNLADPAIVASPNTGERTFHELAESLPQLVWMTDTVGKVLFTNKRFRDYAGFDPAERFDHGIDLVHPDEMAEIAQSWAHSLATGEPLEAEYRLRRNDGEYRSFLARGVALRNGAGAIERWIGTCVDVHDQKLSEQALRRSEKLAAAGRLAASVAHEINNPLEAVTNLLFLLANSPSLDRTAREYVNTAQQELARVAEITTQMLRFHKQSTAPAPARIADMLDSILALYRARIIASEIQLTRDYRMTEPLTCLAGDIRQALANVIGNAIDATPRNGRLRVRLRHSRDWKTRRRFGIRVTIGDTGRGIEKLNIERIFEPFFSTKGITGTGLGLWITTDLIHKHRGDIALRSTTNFGASGTVFSIFLPFEAGLREEVVEA